MSNLFLSLPDALAQLTKNRPTVPLSELLEWEDGISEQETDRMVRAVYADWLKERGCVEREQTMRAEAEYLKRAAVGVVLTEEQMERWDNQVKAGHFQFDMHLGDEPDRYWVIRDRNCNRIGEVVDWKSSWFPLRKCHTVRADSQGVWDRMDWKIRSTLLSEDYSVKVYQPIGFIHTSVD
jgi:uncharacterized protein (TIGR02996 family)